MEFNGSIKDFCCQDWPAPKKGPRTSSLLGFTNFYRALVSGYSDITCHLTKLLRKTFHFLGGQSKKPRLKVKGRIRSTRIPSPSE
ncbi:hypothetical protein BASA83_000584 [Batrachochytrium salamandrivorans]|nr:hypothetical protein BASA83_000584 [Batrachochytrium salamandrivorans]